MDAEEALEKGRFRRLMTQKIEGTIPDLVFGNLFNLNRFPKLFIIFFFNDL